jgi:type IV secretory pathway protease TraF
MIRRAFSAVKKCYQRCNGMSKKKALKIVFIALMFVLIVFNNIMFVTTDSLGKNVFHIKGRFPKIERGDYVSLTVIYPYSEIPEEIKVVKKIGCVEGQTLAVKGRNFYCDNFYLGRAREKTMSGKKVNMFVYNGKVPEGKVFLIAPHEYSFDSRYFGFVEVEKLELLLSPLF